MSVCEKLAHWNKGFYNRKCQQLFLWATAIPELSSGLWCLVWVFSFFWPRCLRPQMWFWRFWMPEIQWAAGVLSWSKLSLLLEGTKSCCWFWTKLVRNSCFLTVLLALWFFGRWAMKILKESDIPLKTWDPTLSSLKRLQITKYQ